MKSIIFLMIGLFLSGSSFALSFMNFEIKKEDLNSQKFCTVGFVEKNGIVITSNKIRSVSLNCGEKSKTLVSKVANNEAKIILKIINQMDALDYELDKTIPSLSPSNNNKASTVYMTLLFKHKMSDRAMEQVDSMLRSLKESMK